MISAPAPGVSWFSLPRVILLLLLMVILGLQSRLWFGEGSLAEVWQLRQDVAKKKQENAALLARNQRLAAEVSDLKQGTEALEGRARSQLGMIKEGETFYLILDK